MTDYLNTKKRDENPMKMAFFNLRIQKAGTYLYRYHHFGCHQFQAQQVLDDVIVNDKVGDKQIALVMKSSNLAQVHRY